jgi:hypothetical protein
MMFSMTPMIAAPMIAPTGLLTLPVVATPPMTGAAIEVNTHTSPIDGCEEPSRATISIPARTAKKPVNMKQMILIRFTRIPKTAG